MPIGDAVNANLACVTGFFCHEDEHVAISRGAEGANFIGYSLGHYYVFGRHRPGAGDLWAEYRNRRTEMGFDPEAVALAAGHSDTLGAKVVQDGTSGLRGATGTPEQVRAYLRRYEDCGVDQVILSCAAGRNRHEHIMESLELFGRDVLPEFVERDERRQREKAGAPRAGDRGRDGAQAAAATIRRWTPTTRSPRTRASTPIAKRATSSTAGSTTTPPRSPPAKTSASGSPESRTPTARARHLGAKTAGRCWIAITSDDWPRRRRAPSATRMSGRRRNSSSNTVFTSRRARFAPRQ